MNISRYTRWDGSQRVRLSVTAAFDKLAEYLSCTDDIRQALEWIMRQGLDLESGKIAGLDDLLEQLRQEIRQRHRDFNLKEALDEPGRRLDDLLRREREMLEAMRQNSGVAEKLKEIERMPQKLSEALRRLENYQFEDSKARADYEDLLKEYENIRDLEIFRERQGQKFRGPKSLEYPEAVDLMRSMEKMRDLEQALSAGQIDRLTDEDVRMALGAEGLQDLENLKQLALMLEQSGYLMPRGEHLTLSPKGVRRIGQLALRDIFRGLLRDRPGGHRVEQRGVGEIRPDSTRPYVFGDPLNLNLVETLKHALARNGGTPLKIEPHDFEIYENDLSATSSTVLCLDMSWSMSWEGRFAAAKKVAMAMETLIRSKYPRDYFAIVGFFTRAVELKLRDLPDASWNMGDPFTNLQDGLRLASELLARHRSRNQNIIVITDGQPTAYFLNKRVYCEWPLSFGGISMRAAQETLKEVERVTHKGITINTFMLDDSPSLRSFVEKMTSINRGRAFFTRPDNLGEYILVDYLTRRRRYK
jgi:uncharacterized protein with von Willebrand factor type A (vWA) domain